MSGRSDRSLARPLALALGVAILVAVVLAGYCVWLTVGAFTVEGDDAATTLDRALVSAIAALAVVCFTYAAITLFRYLRGREIRWWATLCTYLAGLLAVPGFWVAYLANLSGG